MKIGIDVDGVLTNLEDYQLKYGKKYFGEDAIVNENGYDIKDIFGCTDEEREKFWLKYIWGYCLKEPIREDLVEYINRLKAEGHEIHIITGRAHTTEQNITGELFRKMLLYKLNQAGLKFDSITYCSEKESAEEKFEICKKLGIEVMLEDKKENIESISTISKIVCFDTKYNNFKFNNNVIRINKNENLEQRISPIITSKIYHGDYKPFEKDEYKFSYGIIRNIGVPLFNIAYKPTIINKEFIPKKGSIILCGNHLHVWDQFPVIASTDRVTHWMAKKEYFDGKMGPIFRNTGAICVDRYGDAKKGENEALNYLKVGSAVGMFAEGTRNKLKAEQIEKIYNNIYSISENSMFDKTMDEFKKIASTHLTSQVNLLEKLYEENRISLYSYIYSITHSPDQYLKYLVDESVITNEEYYNSLLLPFKFGCVSMAKKTNSQIVPFAVTGDYKIGNDNLMVRYGEPYYVETDNLEKENEKLRRKILKLVIENHNSVKKQ